MGLALGIAAALCWVGLDVVRKALANEATPTALAVFLLLGQLPFLALWAAVDPDGIVRDIYWLPAIASMGMNASANVLFMRSVQLSPLSRTVPFLALSPVFGALAAIPLLGEVPSAMHWVAMGLVVLGALVLNSDLSGSWVGAVKVKEKGAPHMIGVAALWAASLAFDKIALPHSSADTHALVLTLGSGLMLLTWLAARGQLGELRAAWHAPKPLLVGLVGFAVAAIAFQMLALYSLWVAVLETLKRGLGVVGSIVFGRLFFAESVTGTKLIAAALMVAGTALLALT